MVWTIFSLGAPDKMHMHWTAINKRTPFQNIMWKQDSRDEISEVLDHSINSESICRGIKRCWFSFQDPLFGAPNSLTTPNAYSRFVCCTLPLDQDSRQIHFISVKIWVALNSAWLIHNSIVSSTSFFARIGS